MHIGEYRCIRCDRVNTEKQTISSSFGCNEASSNIECSTSTVDHSNEEMEEDADEEESESDETLTVPDAV